MHLFKSETNFNSTFSLQSLDERTPIKDEWIINEMDEVVLSKICPTEFMHVKDEEIVIWVDPLDGTSDYTQGFLDYVTVLIGIAVNGKAIAGVIHQPYHNYQVEFNFIDLIDL